MPQKSKVRKYKWNIYRNGNKEEFFFGSQYNAQNNKWSWNKETKSTSLYEVENDANEHYDYMYSYVTLLKKAYEDTNLDIEFIITDDKLVEKSCRINNNTFKGKIVL